MWAVEIKFHEFLKARLCFCPNPWSAYYICIYIYKYICIHIMACFPGVGWLATSIGGDAQIWMFDVHPELWAGLHRGLICFSPVETSNWKLIVYRDYIVGKAMDFGGRHRPQQDFSCSSRVVPLACLPLWVLWEFFHGDLEGLTPPMPPPQLKDK